MLAFASFPFTASTVAFATSSVCQTVPDNLLVNCGFETGDFTGWSNTATSYTAVDNSNPNSGNYAADLGSETATFLTQQVSDVSGSYYQFSFELENEIANDASGQPYAGNNLFYVYYEDASGGYHSLAQFNNLAQTNAYTQYTYYFFGTGTDTLIFLYNNVPSYFELDDVVFKDPPAPGADLMSDDTIAATPTPEPSSLVLMGTGVFALAAFPRRKLLNGPVTS